MPEASGGQDARDNQGFGLGSCVFHVCGYTWKDTLMKRLQVWTRYPQHTNPHCGFLFIKIPSPLLLSGAGDVKVLTGVFIPKQHSSLRREHFH